MMIRWRFKKIVCFFLFIGLNACVDPISLSVGGNANLLVVDGLITDELGPYVIKLSRTIPFDNNQPLRVYSIPEKGALVTLTDNEGHSQQLTEVESGSYLTHSITGKVGNTYTISIQTKDGKKYHSAPEKMNAVASVAELQYEFKTSDVLFVNSNGSPRVQKLEEFYIYAVVNDPLELGNSYRWQSSGIFEFFSLTGIPEIKQCWAPTLSRLERNLSIYSDRESKSSQIRQLVGVVNYDRPTYYQVKVKQQSITEGAYEFFKRMRQQQTTTGSIFDAAPTPIVGNIVSENDEDEVVLGYFGASAVTEATLLINRFAGANYLPPTRNIAIQSGDCRNHEPDATNVKPVGFN